MHTHRKIHCSQFALNALLLIPFLIWAWHFIFVTPLRKVASTWTLQSFHNARLNPFGLSTDPKCAMLTTTIFAGQQQIAVASLFKIAISTITPRHSNLSVE